MMKIRLISLVLVFPLLLAVVWTNEVCAQQIPVFNQYQYSPEFYNPAALGKGFIGFQYRSQFSSLKNDLSPQTFALNTDLSSILNLSEKNIALGLSLQSDQVHLLKRLKGKLSFAYHLLNDQRHCLSAGIEAGLFSQRLNLSETLISNPTDLVIYDGEYQKSIFNGGLGIHYHYTTKSEQVLNINVVVPQLFTSDLIYDENREFGINTHLIAAASYRFPIGTVGLEPHLLYQNIFSGGLSQKGSLDLSLRAHFLDDRFWLGGGTRLGATAYQASFGVKVTDRFDLQASLETHDIFGSTWELQVTYTLGETKSVFVDNFKNLAFSSKQAIEKTKDLVRVANQELLLAKELLKEAKRPGISQVNLAAKVRASEDALAKTKTVLEKAISPAKDVSFNKQQAITQYKEAVHQNKVNKSIERSYSTIKDLADRSNTPIIRLIHGYQQTINDLRQLKVDNGLQVNNLSSMVKNRDVVNLETYYQKALRKAVGIPKSVGPINVTTDGISLKLKHQYSYTQSEYKLEEGLNAPRFMANHIIQQIEDLQAKQVDIVSIIIRANMQARNASLEDTNQPTPYTEDQFGYRVDVNYRFFDEVKKTIKTETTTVEPGIINLKQLACLKLHGLQRYFGIKGISPAKIPINFEMSASNFDQEASEVYEIIVEFK